jgi:hypothetical protein
MSDDQIVQRWRKPVTPLAVADTVEWANADLGRATLDYRARFTPEQIERFRLGYVCLTCWEPHESPFPERCAVCGYQMRARQGDDFAAKFQGVERDPRSELIERELDKLDDKHERNFYETKSGIVVPRGVN